MFASSIASDLVTSSRAGEEVVSVLMPCLVGELLREMPKATNQHDARQVVGTPTSTRQAEREAGIGHSTSIDLQAMAANPEIVHTVAVFAHKSDGPMHPIGDYPLTISVCAGRRLIANLLYIITIITVY